MAVLISAVRKEINRLRKNISKQTTLLRELTHELKRHEKIVAMLEKGSAQRGSVTQTKTKGKRTSTSRTNWTSLLKGLPRTFTVAQVSEAAGRGANQADVHQALLRWRKAGRIASRQRGKYRKTGTARN